MEIEASHAVLSTGGVLDEVVPRLAVEVGLHLVDVGNVLLARGHWRDNVFEAHIIIYISCFDLGITYCNWGI